MMTIQLELNRHGEDDFSAALAGHEGKGETVLAAMEDLVAALRLADARFDV